MSIRQQIPEFVAWTLALPCPLRAGSDAHSPERTERHLRALRATGEGLAEGRVRTGICLGRYDPNLGFRVADAVAVFGGLSAAEQNCRACPANATLALGTSALAGCYGELPRTDDKGLDWAVIVDNAIRRLGMEHAVAQAFAPTSPPWYGLWIAQPLTTEQLEILGALWGEGLRIEGRSLPAALLFGEAISRAKQTALPLFVELHPPGQADAAGNWLVPAICPRCRAVWSDRSSSCTVCGWHGHHIGARRRKLRGQRPYRPLGEFLSAEEVERILRSDES